MSCGEIERMKEVQQEIPSRESKSSRKNKNKNNFNNKTKFTMMAMNICFVQSIFVLFGLVHFASADEIKCAATEFVTLHDKPKTTDSSNVKFSSSLIPMESVCPIPNYCFNVSGNNSLIGSVQTGNVLELDKESGKERKVVHIKCKDNIDKICCIKLSFTYENTFKPKFEKPSYTHNVNESEPIGFSVFDISQHITDEDKWSTPTLPKSKYKLDIEPSEINDMFVSDENGIIKLNKLLDYDNGTRKYTINITFEDCGRYVQCPDPFTTNTLLYINVQNSNDEGVKFNNKIYFAQVKEYTKTGEVGIFPQPDVTDLEVGSTEDVVYMLEDALPTSFFDYFRFDNVARKLVIEKAVSRKDHQNFTVTLKAFKKNREKDTFDKSLLLVNILRGNSYPPLIINTPSEVNITEVLPINSPVVLVQSHDKDNDELTYHFVGQHPMFQIHKESGLVTLSQPVQQKLATFPVTLQVYAEENNTNERYQSHIHNIVVNVVDENTHNPVFANKSYLYNIPLTTKAGQPFATIRATDEDKSINGKVTYEIIPKNVPFKIDSVSGDLSVFGTLQTGSYNFTVIGHDGATNPRSSVVMVTVSVTSANRKPTFSSLTPKTLEILETTAPETILTTILATDPDDDKLTFQVVSTADYFDIVPSPDKVSHVLRLKKWLNESTLNSIYVSITVSDNIETATTGINITIIPVNSYVPVFDHLIYTFSINENDIINTSVGKVLATDKDGDAVEYYLPGDKYFNIDAGSGIITIKQKLNKPTKYCFVVQAFDSNKQHYGVAQVVVDVKDSNNKKPKFEKDSIQITVQEDKMCGEPIYTPKATDDDISPENQANVYSTNDPHFVISNGSLYLKNSSCKNETFLERRISLVITASNKNNMNMTGTMKVEIYFKDINNHIPEFETVPSSLSVDESTPVGSSLYRVSVKDKDIADINRLTRFSIKDQNPNMDKIRIDPLTGVLYLNKPLDYDNPSQDRNITFKVVAENIVDNVGVGSNQNFVNLAVVTVDEDDIPLQFENDTYVANINEDLPPNTVIFEVKATKGAQYSIDDTKLPFRINSTGHLTLHYALHHNSKTSYVFPIEARNKNEKRTATAVITINNVNDAPTIHEPLEFTISKNLPARSIIGHIFATDPDNDALIYQLNDTNFFLNSTTGNLYSKMEFDYEARKSLLKPFTFNVTVSDKHLSDTKQITVAVNNGTEPFFSKTLYSVKLPGKNITPNQFVTSVPASNPDKSRTLTYKIYGDNRFEIQNNGNVIINSNFQVKPIKDKVISLMIVADNGFYKSAALLMVEVIKPFEFVKSHFNLFVKQNTSVGTDIFQLSPNLMVDTHVDISNLTVTLSNSVVNYNSTCRCIITSDVLDKQIYNVTLSFSQNSSHSSTQLIIHVLPVNSHHPKIWLQKDEVDVLDNVSPGYVVSNVTANDTDFIPGFTFYLTETYNKFHIDSSNGTLTVTNSLNYLLGPSYSLAIYVQDHGSPPLISQKNLTIKVINSNKFSPQFQNLQTNITINENSNSKNIFQVTANDGDSDNVTYAITKGNLNQAFEIDNVTGVVSVKNSKELDFENVKKFELTIVATDNAKNPQSTSEVVTIYLLDMNDNSPRFQSLSYFARNLPIAPNQEVFEVNAVDHDSSRNNNNVITYSVLNYVDLFNINNVTGKVTSKKNLTDRMTYFIVVQACDGGQLCTSHTVQLLTSSSIPLIAYVKENVSDAFVVNVNASRTLNVTYYLKTCSDLFTIDSKSGILRTKLPLRWDPIQNNFTLTVVEDSSKNSSEITVIVIVEDINDHDPEFQQPSYEFSVKENSIKTFFVKATDADSLLHGNITYNLRPFTLKEGSVTIEPFTGRLNVSGLDMEESSKHSLEVVANDNGNPARQSTVTVSIRVEDQNDNRPVFGTSSRAFSVKENDSPNLFVTRVTATDADSGSNGQVFYTLVNSSLPFTINPTTGDLYTIHSLDYETNTMYTIEILASDLGEPQLNNTHTITVNVTDVCDDQIQLRPTVYIANNIAVDRTMLAFASSASETAFTLAKDQGIFSIDESSGGVSISSGFPSQPNSYNITVTAQNRCNITVEEEVTIKLYNAPKIGSGSVIEIEVLEETVSNRSLFNFSSLEEFQGPNVEFQLTNYKEYFYIKDEQLMLKKPIDRENKPTVTLIVDVVKSTRVKRSVASNNNNNIVKTLKIVVKVKDSNDNSPQFSTDTLYFGIPISASQFFEIGTIQAEDKDAGENSVSVYSLTGKDKDQFYMNPSTGNLHNLFVPAAVTQKEYTVTVVAVDKAESTKNDTVIVMMAIYSDEFSLILTVNATDDKVQENRQEIIRNLSKLLDLQIVIDHIQVHIDRKNRADVNRTDILFHAVNKDTMKVISKEELEQKLEENEEEISSLLKRLKLNMMSFKEVESIPVRQETKHGFDKNLIIIIVLIIIILIIPISTVILFVIISKRYKNKFDELQSLLFNQSNINEGYEKSEIGMTSFERNSNNSSGHVSGSSFDTEASLYNSVPLPETTNRNQETPSNSTQVPIEDQPTSSETQKTPLENQQNLLQNLDSFLEGSNTNVLGQESEDRDVPDYGKTDDLQQLFKRDDDDEMESTDI
ncbi:protocadherin Fat 4-like isoform X3 [Octopus sinensis]|uniref:Protocadherin Fat 4-like isoform X3 n=1 Tax=Octopus sinensis TaxID=2607531 RepID=A0A6P7TKC2_9MOLL|nr:protocadherin Fat 4-like isoform X3 [Octopus sinensis]